MSNVASIHGGNEDQLAPLPSFLGKPSILKVDQVWIWLEKTKKVGAKLVDINEVDTVEIELPIQGLDFSGCKRLGFSVNTRYRDYPVFSTAYRVTGNKLALKLPPITMGRDVSLVSPIEASVTSCCSYLRAEKVAMTGLTPICGHFEVSYSDVGFLPSMPVNLTVSRYATKSLKIRVVSVAPLNQGRVRVQFIVEKVSRNDAAKILLLNEPGFSLHSAKNHLISRIDYKRFLSVKQVTTRNEFLEVLELRRDANQYFGRRLSDLDPRLWNDALDDVAIQSVVKLGEKCVGAVRLLVNEDGGESSEISDVVTLPSWLKARRFAEVSRMVIHPEYRSSQISVELMREVARLALAHRCDYILLDCIEKLRPIYEKVGAVKLPGEKTHPYSDEKVHVMYIDIRGSLTQLDSKIAYWLYLFGPVVSHHFRVFKSAQLSQDMSLREKMVFRLKLGMSHVIS